ncbi:TonB-dependent siderophore receptor [Microvirgula aerodenitrificans]|uniref:TonB-dependent siderophore receptor n=1 Tax=Microvirgula aerodenitrificans TaxID=57480 RepID=UPI000AACA255|nr:TonB-dependent receptor [Microvirgula aerodenitrificans]
MTTGRPHATRMAATAPCRKPDPLALAVTAALLGLSLTSLSLPALAAEPAAATAGKNHHIAAGPLGRVLSGFAASAGVLLSFDPAVTAGKTSPGLDGRYTPQQGFARLLAGTGLEAVANGSGGYVLKTAPKPAGEAAGSLAGVQTLAAVDVNARGLGARTDGTGSYTTGSTSTATKLPLSLRETPQSVSVITRQQMDDRGLTQIDEVLKATVGITVTQAGAAGTDSNALYSRGFAIENYQIDGIPQYSNSTQDVNDMALYDRVEVVRGATGLMNGVGSPSATVNLVRKRPKREFEASVSATVGSWDFYRTDVDLSVPITEGGNVRARLVAALQDNDSWVDRLKERKAVFSAIVEADLTPDTTLAAGFDVQHHDSNNMGRAGAPLFFSDGSKTNFSRSFNSGADWAYYNHHKSSFFGSLEHRFDNDWLAKLVLTQSRDHYDAVLGYAGGGYPDRQTGAGVSLWAGRWNQTPVQNALDFYASGPFSLFGRKHDLVVGFNMSRTSSDDPTYPLWRFPGWDSSVPDIYKWDGSNPAKPDIAQSGNYHFSERQSGAYMTARFRPTDALSVIVGSRVSNWSQDTYNHYYDGSSDSGKRGKHGVVTPYLGVVYDLNDNWSVYTSYTNIFKPQDSKDSSGQYLDPLEGNSYEAGIKGAFYDGRLNASLAVFKVDQDNLAVEDVGHLTPDGNTAYKAAKGTKSRGFEVEVSGEVLTGWQVAGGFTHRTSEDAQGKPVNTVAPEDLFKLSTAYTLPGAWNPLTIGGALVWQSSIYSDRVGPHGERFTQPDYAVLDLMARYRFSRQLSASLNLNNVFDKKYYSTSSSSFYGAPFNVMASVKYTF